MAEDRLVVEGENSSIIAPAGFGKTETIAKAAGHCRRALILTHTHAGVQAVRARLRKLEVPHGRASVDTFAGWCMKYSNSFPKTAQPPGPLPQGEEWDVLYKGTRDALGVSAVRQIVAASYDRVLIDEYQDCNPHQHDVALALSTIVPTTIFGDPMQGIFEFAGASLDWQTTIFPRFPLIAELKIPHRWEKHNRSLGEWISETRKRLIAGNDIELDDDRIKWRQSSDAFDMGVLFEDLDREAERVAAIHCRKGTCISLARATNGAFQAIEELAANRMQEFARDWDLSTRDRAYDQVIRGLFSDCFRQKEKSADGLEEDHSAVEQLMHELVKQLSGAEPALAASGLLYAARDHPRWRLFRSELWRDCERAISEVVNGRCSTMAEAAQVVRQRSNHIGRQLPRRTVSTPLLLKGLEFQDVVIPYAPHFNFEEQAQAKLFYVAISRATRSLVIGAPSKALRFPQPLLRQT
ncbi:UvrD-helicase domain-containing protein [Roseobacter sp. S98]|uniref:UvrD-helicase domain-containing protein n=1 Tax=Roseobacter algicola (ex Choi et al. 2025) (nom. illeg.) TaxID=3092138 RepID=UPI003F5173C0